MAESRQVIKALRGLGFKRRIGQGGHEIWEDGHGRRVNPVFRHKEVNDGALFSLTEQLAGLGVCTRVAFKQALRKA